jgi:hypothetical protein
MLRNAYHVMRNRNECLVTHYSSLVTRYSLLI